MCDGVFYVKVRDVVISSKIATIWSLRRKTHIISLSRDFMSKSKEGSDDSQSTESIALNVIGLDSHSHSGGKKNKKVENGESDRTKTPDTNHKESHMISFLSPDEAIHEFQIHHFSIT